MALEHQQTIAEAYTDIDFANMAEQVSTSLEQRNTLPTMLPYKWC